MVDSRLVAIYGKMARDNRQVAIWENVKNRKTGKMAIYGNLSIIATHYPVLLQCSKHAMHKQLLEPNRTRLVARSTLTHVSYRGLHAVQAK